MKLTDAVVVVVGGVLLLGVVGATQVETVTEVTEATQVEENNEVLPQDYQLTDPEQRIISVGQAEGVGVFVVQFVTLTLVTLSAVYVLYVVWLPYVENRSLSSWNLLDLWPTEKSGWDLLENVTNSLDSAQTLWWRLETNELSCRRLALCEAERAAPAIPVLNAVMTLLRPALRDSKDFREALEAGQTLQDCSLLYSQCPVSLSQAIWH